MKQEAILIEAVALADEILDSGPGDGRGFRLAGLVHRLNEAMVRGEPPLSWHPPVPMRDVLASLPPPPLIPSSLPRAGATVDWGEFAPPPPETELPSPDDLDAAWDQLFSTAPPPKPRITLSPPEYQAGGEHWSEVPDGEFEAD